MTCFAIVENEPKFQAYADKRNGVRRNEPGLVQEEQESTEDVRPMGRKRSKRAAGEAGLDDVSTDIKEMIALMKRRMQNEETDARLLRLKVEKLEDHDWIKYDNSKITCPRRLAYVERQQALALTRLDSDYYCEINGNGNLEEN